LDDLAEAVYFDRGGKPIQVAAQERELLWDMRESARQLE
jgi:hypothetical protein